METREGSFPKGVIGSVPLGNPPGDVPTLDRPEILEELPRHEG